MKAHSRLRRTLRALREPMPVYVTRKDAHGATGTVSLSIAMVLLGLMFVWANVVLWGVYGVAQALGLLLG